MPSASIWVAIEQHQAVPSTDLCKGFPRKYTLQPVEARQNGNKTKHAADGDKPIKNAIWQRP